MEIREAFWLSADKMSASSDQVCFLVGDGSGSRSCCVCQAFTCKACNCWFVDEKLAPGTSGSTQPCTAPRHQFPQVQRLTFCLFLRKTTQQHVKQSARRGFWWFPRNHWCITNYIYSESMSRWRFFGFASLLSENAEANSCGAFGSIARLQELAAIWFKRICELGTPRWQTAAITSIFLVLFLQVKLQILVKMPLPWGMVFVNFIVFYAFLCPAFCSTVKLAGLYARISFSLVRGTEVAFSHHFFFNGK